jgi:glycosyltransferase involved in cell wall biosynthesis
MDYPPNVAAVEMFARDVMPLIRRTFAGASFHIVGRAPVQSVRALEGVNGTHVTGAVLDVRSWIAGADLIVAPLTIARGVQNKVLEAMAMARPVLATPEAATGIPARDGMDFVVAQGAEALARQALALLHDPVRSAEIGQSARAFVMRECGWDHVLAPLGAMLGIVGDEASSAAA